MNSNIYDFLDMFGLGETANSLYKIHTGQQLHDNRDENSDNTSSIHDSDEEEDEDVNKITCLSFKELTDNLVEVKSIPPTETNLGNKEKLKKLRKSINPILNKLSNNNFDQSCTKVRSLQFDTLDDVQLLVDVIFDKAIKEPHSSLIYARLCSKLYLTVMISDDKKMSFRPLLVTKCQMEFDKCNDDYTTRNNKVQKIFACEDEDTKGFLVLDLEEFNKRLRKRYVNTIRFIGELYLQGIMFTSLIRRCVERFIDNKDDESCECLSTLLSVIGEETPSPKLTYLSDILDKIKDLIHDKDAKIKEGTRRSLKNEIYKFVAGPSEPSETLDELSDEPKANTFFKDLIKNNTSDSTVPSWSTVASKKPANEKTPQTIADKLTTLLKIQSKKFCNVCQLKTKASHFRNAEHFLGVRKWIEKELSTLKTPIKWNLIYCQVCNVALSGTIDAKTHNTSLSHMILESEFCWPCLRLIGPKPQMDGHRISKEHLMNAKARDKKILTTKSNGIAKASSDSQITIVKPGPSQAVQTGNTKPLKQTAATSSLSTETVNKAQTNQNLVSNSYQNSWRTQISSVPAKDTPTIVVKHALPQETEDTSKLSNEQLQRLLLLEQLDVAKLQKEKESLLLSLLRNKQLSLAEFL